MSDSRLWLPTSLKECTDLGWQQLDVILFSGDAYIDHPSFGAAVIGRVLQSLGFKVAIIPQPNWQDDLRDFKKLGRPRLFFGVTAGTMDSMVNRYTANKRLRSEDAYTPDGRHTGRPEYATVVYSTILKRLYPDVPVVIGGIEASMRRLTHYDYWQNKLLPSILTESKADWLIYGMGEKPIAAIASAINSGKSIQEIREIPQIGYLDKQYVPRENDILLNSHSECLNNRMKQAENFKSIETESNKIEQKRIVQQTDNQFVVINPSYAPLTTAELDAIYDLPYTRLPHPRYKGKRIPAYEMIRHSVTLHRGCFGGCAFCTISAHQGKQISSRSIESVVREVKNITAMPDFKGYISDLGGPSANMYAMGGINKELCKKCARPSCLHPNVCKNLNTDLRPLLQLYHAADSVPGVKKSFIGSGIRYDILLHRHADSEINSAARQYTRELIEKHVSGRLKVAPEHTSPKVLNLMRKPSFELFKQFSAEFFRINRELGLKQQLIPYFISSHPGCTQQDMAELACATKKLDFKLEQVQDFTPTPMTLSTEIFYSGINPYTGQQVFTATTPAQKLEQKEFFFWYDVQHRRQIMEQLRKIGRQDLIKELFSKEQQGRDHKI